MKTHRRPQGEWIPPRNEFSFLGSIKVSPAEFDDMKHVGATIHFIAPAYTLCKALLQTDRGQRWHAIDRQYQFGMPVYFARPIVVRVPAVTR